MYFTDYLAIKLELVNIYKYANQLICIFELHTNGQFDSKFYVLR